MGRTTTAEQVIQTLEEINLDKNTLEKLKELVDLADKYSKSVVGAECELNKYPEAKPTAPS